MIEDVHRQAWAYFVGNSDIEEPTAGDLWEKAPPSLEKALAIYDRQQAGDTPTSTWIPFRTTKESCKKDLETTLNSILVVLGRCGAAGYRTRIRNLQVEIATSQARIGKYREQLPSAE